MLISKSVVVAAGATTDNLLTNTVLSFLGNPRYVTLAASTTAAGVTAQWFNNTTPILGNDGSPVNVEAAGVIDPRQDTIIPQEAVMGSQVFQLTNTTGGDLTVVYRIYF